MVLLEPSEILLKKLQQKGHFKAQCWSCGLSSGKPFCSACQELALESCISGEVYTPFSEADSPGQRHSSASQAQVLRAFSAVIEDPGENLEDLAYLGPVVCIQKIVNTKEYLIRERRQL